MQSIDFDLFDSLIKKTVYFFIKNKNFNTKLIADDLIQESWLNLLDKLEKNKIRHNKDLTTYKYYISLIIYRNLLNYARNEMDLTLSLNYEPVRDNGDVGNTFLDYLRSDLKYGEEFDTNTVSKTNHNCFYNIADESNSEQFIALIMKELVSVLPNENMSKNFDKTWIDLFKYVLYGMTLKEIGNEIGASIATASKLRDRLFDKLNSI